MTIHQYHADKDSPFIHSHLLSKRSKGHIVSKRKTVERYRYRDIDAFLLFERLARVPFLHRERNYVGMAVRG